MEDATALPFPAEALTAATDLLRTCGASTVANTAALFERSVPTADGGGLRGVAAQGPANEAKFHDDQGNRRPD